MPQEQLAQERAKGDAGDRLVKSLSAPLEALASRVTRYRFQFEALDEVLLPAYTGSMWRGLLGYGMRRAVCVTRAPTCEGCLLAGTCVYSTLFESPGPGSTMPRYQRMPHPFVLVPDASTQRRQSAGETIRLGITLVGAANASLPYLIHALDVAGRRGAGVRNARFVVDRVSMEPALGSDEWASVYDRDGARLEPAASAPPTLPPLPEDSVIELVTPLRVKRRGHFIGPRELTLAELLTQLRRRLRSLAAFHVDPDTALPEAPVDDVRDPPDGHPKLRWHEWTRFSSRQDTKMQMGGVVGRMVPNREAIRRHWEMLWLGQWLHIGKGTSMGLGRYRVTPVASSLAPRAGTEPGNTSHRAQATSHEFPSPSQGEA